MNYKISIVDDNPTDLEYVTTIVRGWAEENRHTVSVSGFPSAEAFLFQYEDGNNFDILLLDIEMSGMSGVDLAKRLRQENETVQLVFITGFPDFVAEGYEVSALHYLMKPVSSKKLCTVLDKAASNLAKSEKRLPVTHERQTDFVPLSHIYYIEAQKQYILIHTVEKTYRMKASLAETQSALDEFFIKCQRSFLVNLRHVARVNTGCVVLKNGAEVPISRGMAEVISREIIRLF